MASYYVFKPVRGSLYLHYLGPDNLPYAYLMSTLVALVGMSIYNRIYLLLDARRVFSVSVIALSASAVLFYVAEAAELISSGLFSFLFFLWVSLQGTLSATLCWSVTNNNFDVVTGRKVYGFIGAGGISGAFFGGWVTKTILAHKWLSTEQLLLVGAGLILLALVLVRGVRGAAQHAPPDALLNNPAGKEAEARDGAYWIAKEPYVAGIALLVLLMTFSGTLLDLQFNRVVAETLTDKDAKTEFFGELYAWMNILGLIIQFTLTSAVHRWYGPIPGLLILPLLIMIGGLSLINPSLDAISIIWTGILATTYSINQTSKELLYIPTPPSVRFGAKAYIDVFVYRLGDAGASITTLLWKSVMGVSTALGLLVLVLAPISVFVVSRLRLGYRHRADHAETAVGIKAYRPGAP